jgi:hypothetical protein
MSDHFIREYKLKDPSNCDKIIDLFHYAKSIKATYKGVIDVGIVDPDIKDSEDFVPTAVPDEVVSLLPDPDKCGYSEVVQEMKSLFAQYCRDVELYFWGRMDLRDPPQIQYYQPGGGFKVWHVDNVNGFIERQFVLILYLNDVPNGGTEFKNQNYTCSAEKGKLLIFPANFAYVHRGQISETHEKYILTGWIYTDILEIMGVKDNSQLVELSQSVPTTPIIVST